MTHHPKRVACRLTSKIKIPLKKKPISNKAQYPLEGEGGEAYKDSKALGTFNLLIDKITLVAHAPSDEVADEIRKAIYFHLVGQQDFEQLGKSKSGYQITGKLKLPAVGRSAFFQALPKSSELPFVRLEFNPSKLGEKGLAELHAFLVTFLPDGYQFWLKYGRVSRIDLAADLLVENSRRAVDDFIALPADGPYRREFGKAGRLETIYLGTSKGNQWCIYRKDLQQRKKGRALPPTIRVERMLRNPNVKLISLPELKNEFSKITLATQLPTAPEGTKDAEWLMFSDSVKVRGVTNALQLLPGNRRTKYRKHISASSANWWDPETLWMQFPQVLEAIKLCDIHSYS